MKEIGAKLKEARESMGISIEEVAEDLKLRTNQVENIEEGNMEAFQDIFYLKYIIRDYSKYLGLKYEDMVDEFNEYLFDYTSQISLEDIKKAKKENRLKKDDEKKVSSPYTKEYKRKGLPTWLIYFLALLLVIGIVLLLYFLVLGNN